MYIVVIEEGAGDRKEKVNIFSDIITARSSMWKYIKHIDSTREEYDIVEARLYGTDKRGRCRLIDQFCDQALKDGYAEGWKSEGRREAEHQQWEADREAEREWRAKYVAEPVEDHAN